MVDYEAKTFTTYTRNINFAKLMTVTEKNTFYVSPENDSWYNAILSYPSHLFVPLQLIFSVRTCCIKQAWVKCNVFGISKPVEKFGVERYKKNAKKVNIALTFPFSLSSSLSLLRLN